MAVEYAQDIAVHCAPLAVQAVKAQLDADATGDPASSVADARRIAHEPARRPDVAEGARAFLEKRAPAFAPLPARARQGDDGRPGVEGLTVDALAVRGPTWAQMYARHAHADRPAVVSASRAWTFRELTRDAAGWASWLDSAGLPAGRPVAVLLGSSPMAYALLLAGALTARPLAPLGDRLTISELTACLSPLGAGALVADEEHAALGRELAARADLACRVLPDAAPACAGDLDLAADGDAIALVLHTSGTTGLKPVRFRMDRLGLRARVYAELLELRPDDVYSSSQQFHHLGGVGLLMVAMAVGAAVVPPVTRFSADSWAALGELGTTHATLAPAMIERLLAAGTIRLPRLRTVTYGSSPIRPATAARLLAEHPSIGLLQGYSQTEGGPITALTPDDHRGAAAHRPELLGSVGRAVRGTEVIIRRPDGDGIGEVWARGGHLAAPRRTGGCTPATSGGSARTATCICPGARAT